MREHQTVIEKGKSLFPKEFVRICSIKSLSKSVQVTPIPGQENSNSFSRHRNWLDNFSHLIRLPQNHQIYLGKLLLGSFDLSRHGRAFLGRGAGRSKSPEAVCRHEFELVRGDEITATNLETRGDHNG